MGFFKNIGRVLKHTFLEFFQENSFFHGAALAYYAVFAIVPIIYLAVSSFGKIMGQEEIMRIIEVILSEQLGMDNPEGVLAFLSKVHFEKSNVILNIVGSFALLFSSSALIMSLRTSINEFYNIEVHIDDKKAKIFHKIITKLISVFMLAFFGLSIVFLYTAETVFLSLSSYIYKTIGLNQVWLMNATEHLLTFGINMILFALIYKYVHDGKVKWKIAFIGGAFTSVLLYFGQLGLKYYLSNFFFGSQMGVAGTILIFLAWMYYSSQIIFLGAKFVKVYSEVTHSPITFQINRFLQNISNGKND